MAVKTTVLGIIGLLTLGAARSHAQDPPPPAVPPVATAPAPVQPPVTMPPAAAQPPAVAETKPPVRVELTAADLRRRRDAIFLMEGVLVNAVRMGAGRTAAQIEAFQPGLGLFTRTPPQARGNHLEDYGVFFQVEIPTVMPSVVDIVETLARRQASRPTVPAQPAAATAPVSMDVLMDPDAAYVQEIKTVLIDTMLDYSKSLELRPTEWLTVSARGDDASPGPLSQPSIMILRIKGSDLLEFLAGRLPRQEVRDRVQVQGFSGR